MTDTLQVFGQTFTGVTGIKAEDNNGNVLTFTRGGGGTPDYPWLPYGAEYLGKKVDWTATLADTSFPSWTPSTTATVILQEAAVADQVKVRCDINDYDYAFLARFQSIPSYNSGHTNTAYAANYVYCYLYYLSSAPTGFTALSTGDFYTVSTTTYSNPKQLVYYNSSGALASANVSYGPAYISSSGVSYDTFTSGIGDVVIARPSISARCSTTYFTTANAAYINSSNSTLHYRVDAFRIAKPVFSSMASQFVCDMYNGQSWNLT